MGEETNPHLAPPSCHRVAETEKVPPEPPLPQAEQPQLPQPFLTGSVLQILHQLCFPSLNLLQHLDVFPELREPELNTALEVWPHQCPAEGKNHYEAKHSLLRNSFSLGNIL